MSTFIHKINIWDWVNNIIVYIWMQFRRGQGGDVCGGSVGGIVAMEKVSIFYTVDLKIFKTGFKKVAHGRQ